MLVLPRKRGGLRGKRPSFARSARILEQTFKWLQVSYDGRAVWMSYLAVDPVFDGYRSDQRFQDLLRRVHLLH